MKYSEAKQGRVFVIRLEDGDVLHEEIQRFAREKGISAAALVAIGGADKDSRLVVGPEDGRAEPVVPMEHVLADVSEIAGTGTIFPNEKGEPVLHMHAACGREESTVTGCVRKGVKTWHVMEVILFELVGSEAVRRLDTTTGFELLKP
jgi:predicted DNA-binding protein with PD1-like motif